MAYTWAYAHAYKESHLVEYFFAKIKAFRRIATRYAKLAIPFKASAMLCVPNLAAMNYLETALSADCV